MQLVSLSSWEKFKPCRDNNFFASNKNMFKKWENGEILIFLIDREGVIISRINGKVFFSDMIYWKNDLYPWRIPIEIIKEIHGTLGKRLNNKIRQLLIELYGKHYGVLIQNNKSLPKKIRNKIIAACKVYGVLDSFLS